MGLGLEERQRLCRNRQAECKGASQRGSEEEGGRAGKAAGKGKKGNEADKG